MRLNRRQYSIGLLIGFASLSSSSWSVSAECSTCPKPDEKKFRAGDLLWPKSSHRRIPYSGKATATEFEAATWLENRNSLIAELELEPTLSPSDAQILSSLRKATFQQFQSAYFDGVVPGQTHPHGGTAADPREYVGHVAFIDVSGDEEIWVVEAVGSGVQRIRYSDWKLDRECESIWHGRIAGLTPAQLKEATSKAISQVGKPYSLFDSLSSFNLNDIRSFYCSKLIWHSVMSTSGLALDDKEAETRFWPLSPRQLLESRHVAILSGCGKYHLPQR